MTDPRVRAAIERRRDEPPPRLYFDPPIDRLMDSEHCAALATDLRNVAPGGWERAKATKVAWKMLPSEPGLYMFVWEPEFELDVAESQQAQRLPWILYVGRAGGRNSGNTIRARYRAEYATLVGADPSCLWAEACHTAEGRTERLARYLSVSPLWLWYAVVTDGAQLNQLEQRLFNLLTPPLNRAGGPRLRRSGRPSKAF